MIWEPGRPYATDAFQYSPIVPNRLWLGEAPRDEDMGLLRRLGITDMVNLARLPEIRERQEKAGFRVHWFPFQDGTFRAAEDPSSARANAMKMLVSARDTLHTLLEAGTPTYLHCVAGISRSPTVMLLWMISKGGHQSFRHALRELETQRPVVSPNPELVELVVDLHPEAFQD